MEILISANQGVLLIVTNEEIVVSENMSKDEYIKWISQFGKDVFTDENGIQKV